MSKIGIRKSFSDIVRNTLREGSIEYKLFHSEKWERDRYFEWKQEYDEWCARLIEEHGPTWMFEQLLDDAADHREFAGKPVLRPQSLRDKLFPPFPPSSGDPQKDYEDYVRQGR